MIAALPFLIAVAAHLAPTDCSAFAAEVGRPITISIDAIPAGALGGRAPDPPAGSNPVIARFSIGSLIYQGYGISIHSGDPRFGLITATNGYALAGPCGYGVDGPTGWNAHDRDRGRWTILFRHLTSEEKMMPGSTAAAEQGSTPTLPGYTPGPSWPIYSSKGQFFVALMQPIASASGGSIIVAFAQRAGPSPAQVLAHLSLRFQAISATPDLHSPVIALNLDGRDGAGTLQRVELDMTEEVRDALGAKFGPSRSQ